MLELLAGLLDTAEVNAGRLQIRAARLGSEKESRGNSGLRWELIRRWGYRGNKGK